MTQSEVGDGIDSFPDIMDASEVAQFLKLRREVVRRAMREGKIPAYKTFGRWMIRKDALLTMFDKRP